MSVLSTLSKSSTSSFSSKTPTDASTTPTTVPPGRMITGWKVVHDAATNEESSTSARPTDDWAEWFDYIDKADDIKREKLEKAINTWMRGMIEGKPVWKPSQIAAAQKECDGMSEFTLSGF